MGSMRQGLAMPPTRAPSSTTSMPAEVQLSATVCHACEKGSAPPGSAKIEPSEHGAAPLCSSQPPHLAGSSAGGTPGRSKMCTCDGSVVSLSPPGTALVTPVVSKTSISVHTVPLSFWCSQKLLLMPLEPDRQLISKKPSRCTASECTAAVV